MQNVNYIITTTALSLTLKRDEDSPWERFNIDKESGQFAKVLEILADPDATVEELVEAVTYVPIEMGQFAFENENNQRVLPQVLVNKLEALRALGLPLDSFRIFLNRLMDNPSANSVRQLYDFLSYRDLPITPDGYFLAYKGIGADWYSVKGNPETVVDQGTVTEDGRIFNGVGEIIKVSRNQVNDNRNVACSYGLHVGSYDYANRWGDKMVLVKVDPADAVSVPTDRQFQKLRVCAYQVVSEIEKEIATPVAEEDGTEMVSESVVSREKYIGIVERHLITLVDESDYPDPVSFTSVLGRVGGTTEQLQDALQDLDYYWENDTIYLD